MYNYISIPLRLWDTWTLWILSLSFKPFWILIREQIGILNFLLWRVFSCFGRVTPECARQHLDWYFCVNTQIASQFSVFSDSFAVLCSRSNSQLLSLCLSRTKERAFAKRLKTLHFNEKFSRLDQKCKKNSEESVIQLIFYYLHT